MEELWIAALLADADLQRLVSGRISWLRRRPGDGLPAVVCHLVSRPRTYDFDGETGLESNLIQVDCWAASFLDAKSVARAVEARMATLTAPFTRGFIENERDDVEAAPAPDRDGARDIYRTSLDIRVWRQP